jgi:sec-independent protein translocase protein TatA
MPNIGFPEMILILIVALLVFGPKRLPEVGRSVGKGIREFRKASSDLRNELDMSVEDGPAEAPSTPAPSAVPAHDPHEPHGDAAGNGRDPGDAKPE